MKTFIARTSQDTIESFRSALAKVRTIPGNKVYLIGELGYEWEEVTHFNLDGLVKAPEVLKSLLNEK